MNVCHFIRFHRGFHGDTIEDDANFEIDSDFEKILVGFSLKFSNIKFSVTF